MINQIFEQYKKWKPEIATKNIIYHWLTRERKKAFGNLNYNKTFYVIRPINNKSKFYIGPIHNLLANYFYVVSHLKYAEINNWIPVVDNLNYSVYNSICGEVNGTRNAWEYYWEQPTAFTLDEIYNSGNVVLSKQSWYSQWDMGYSIGNYTDQGIVKQFHSLSEKIPLNIATRDHVKAVEKELFPPKGKILGVAFRYGGHALDSLRHGPGHPIQPEIEELIEIVSDRFNQWKMDYILLTSDEETAVEKFSRSFGDQLLIMSRERLTREYLHTKDNPSPLYSPNNIHQTTLNYLTEMELLSRCDALIGSVTSGLRYAVVRNDGAFEHLEIIDKGKFPDFRKVITNQAKPKGA